jgi:hypothetical protein
MAKELFSEFPAMPAYKFAVTRIDYQILFV